jgi:hypothetical protein
MFGFLIGQSELDIHAVPSLRNFWANSCSGGEILNVVLKNQYPGFENSTVESRFEVASRLLYLSIDDFLNCVGLQPWDQRLAMLKNSNGLSTLDYVAQKLRMIFLEGLSKSELVSWMNLGGSVLKNGADPCNLSYVYDRYWLEDGYDLTEIQMTESGYERLNLRKSTSLFKCLHYCWSTIVSREILEDNLVSLRTWVGMIRDAGIDLLDYGGREKRAWEFLKAQNNECHRCVELTDLIIGQTPNLWGLKVRNRTSFPIYALQQIPGSYPAKRRLPHSITWYPTKKEESEGCWLKVTHKTLFSQERDLEDIPDREPQMFASLVEGVQDDSGPVMIMQYRATRMHNTRPRSCSQPPSLRHRGLDNCSTHESYRRPWLPNYHLCPFDYRWQFNCFLPTSFEGTEKFFSRPAYLAELQSRNCITGNGGFCPSVQQSMQWTCDSFLGGIVGCQEGRSYESRRHYYKKNDHTGTLSCPEGCANICIDQLAVPKALQPFHPARRNRDTCDEVNEVDENDDNI